MVFSTLDIYYCFFCYFNRDSGFLQHFLRRSKECCTLFKANGQKIYFHLAKL